MPNAKPLLPTSGRVLSVADGEGRNSVWLAEQGLDVHAIDFSLTAQDKARALAREDGVNVGAAHSGISAVIGLTCQKPAGG